MIARAQTLALGYSGLRRSTLQLLIDMINRGVHPVIPVQGSVGASGDLAPLSHMAHAMMGGGLAEYRRRNMPACEALRAAGLEPVALIAKEGLALCNGTSQISRPAGPRHRTTRPTCAGRRHLRRALVRGAAGHPRRARPAHPRGARPARPDCRRRPPARPARRQRVVWRTVLTAGRGSTAARPPRTRCRTPTRCAACPRSTARPATRCLSCAASWRPN